LASTIADRSANSSFILVLIFGADIKTAGTASVLISIPIVDVQPGGSEGRRRALPRGYGHWRLFVAG
jgi:hypothetical protein